jgi:hypothetical protein
MPETTTIKPVPDPNTGSAEVSVLDQRNLKKLAFLLFILSVAFFGPLRDWLTYALKNERNTYLVLIPAISAYLIWIKRAEIRGGSAKSAGRIGLHPGCHWRDCAPLLSPASGFG